MNHCKKCWKEIGKGFCTRPGCDCHKPGYTEPVEFKDPEPKEEEEIPFTQAPDPQKFTGRERSTNPDDCTYGDHEWSQWETVEEGRLTDKRNPSQLVGYWKLRSRTCDDCGEEETKTVRIAI